jgi:hypothetical protein
VDQLLHSVHRLLVTANIVPSSPIIVTLMMGALSSSETSVVTKATQRNTPEDRTLHSHLREKLKSNNHIIALIVYLFFYFNECNAKYSHRKSSVASCCGVWHLNNMKHKLYLTLFFVSTNYMQSTINIFPFYIIKNYYNSIHIW